MKLTKKQLINLILENISKEKEVMKIKNVIKDDIKIHNKPIKFSFKKGVNHFNILYTGKFNKLMFSSKNKFIVQSQHSENIQGAERVSIPNVKKNKKLNYTIINEQDIDIEVVIQPVN